jgi:hypothetical protein
MLATSLGKATPHTIGVTVGFVAAGGTSFVLITVPIGIILVGAAQTLSKWLATHGGDVLSKLMGVS